MIRLKSDPAPMVCRPTCRRPWLWRVVLVGFLVVATLVAEHYRGHWALERWKAQASARGEACTPEAVWPRPTEESRTFSNQFQRAIAQLPPRLRDYAGQISPIVLEKPGLARRGSQEPRPVFEYPRDRTNASWADLEPLVRQAQPALLSLRTLLKNPPADMGHAVDADDESLAIPNYVNVRVAAQAMQAAVLADLHRGDLPAARENLIALTRFSRLYRDEPTLVHFMVRIAIVGLTVPIAWDALQADGWTDSQLAELQAALQYDSLLAQMPRTLLAERAARLREIHWFASHSYFAWHERYREILQSFGQPVDSSPAAVASRYYRQWIFHPLWSFAWADQEALGYLKNQQLEVELLQKAVKAGSCKQLQQNLETLHSAYQPSFAEWRFYRRLPMCDIIGDIIGSKADKRVYPYPSFQRAWLTTMKNLTLSRLLTTAIAVKRYSLSHGGPPPRLYTLVPHFMDEVPIDLMDGQPLRYWLSSDGTSCLYSVGENGWDDLANPGSVAAHANGVKVFEGPDLVWPQLGRPAPNGPRLAPITVSAKSLPTLTNSR